MSEWIALRFDVPAPYADDVAALLVDAGAAGVVTGAWDGEPPAGAAQARLEAHLLVEHRAAVEAALVRHLAALCAVDPAVGTPRVEHVAVPAVDWDAQFRAHHRPVVVGARLLVAPPWDVPAAPGREVLVIEPGMAFGTGQHATTRTCLEEIEAVVAAGAVASALDVGTGSGLLAAALVRLGVPRVVALDVDPAVLPLARANLLRNRAARALVLGGRADAVRERFDLVVANLLADIIVAEAAVLAARVAPAGHLVLSGLLDVQTADVLRAFPGWRVARERAESAWRTLHLVLAS
ncbi:MAG: 50S ribosomal protein L11 methyltransferase [Candidatus Binatia bacterium]